MRQWYLQGNGFSDAGMEAICEACAAGGLPQLERLNLCSTRIGDEGCLVLANAIEAGQLDQVRHIQMQQIAAGRDGFEVVDDVIKEYEEKLRVVF